MNSKTLLRALVMWTFLVSVGTLPTFGFRMIRNTTIGTVTSASLVPCYDSGGFAHWSNSNISWYLNAADSAKATPIQNALTSWTNVPDADHTLTYAGTTTAGWATDNQNTVLWASGNGCTGSCLALTALTLQSGQVIVEADVTFNSSVWWPDPDVEAVAAHEFGHTLGIHHTELAGTIYPTMYPYYMGDAARWLNSDDIAALQCAHDVYFSGAPLPSAPPTPASFSVVPYLCYGWATFSWSSSTGATFYEIEQATHGSFTSTWPVYAGTDTGLFYDAGWGTNFFRVRACNWGGCSGYRNGSSAVTFHDPCAN